MSTLRFLAVFAVLAPWLMLGCGDDGGTKPDPPPAVEEEMYEALVVLGSVETTYDSLLTATADTALAIEQTVEFISSLPAVDYCSELGDHYALAIYFEDGQKSFAILRPMSESPPDSSGASKDRNAFKIMAMGQGGKYYDAVPRYADHDFPARPADDFAAAGIPILGGRVMSGSEVSVGALRQIQGPIDVLIIECHCCADEYGVYIYTDEEAPHPDDYPWNGESVDSGTKQDYRSDRLHIGTVKDVLIPRRVWVLTPEFVEHYWDLSGGGLVFIAGCHSAGHSGDLNCILATACISKGAGAYVGYDGFCSTPWMGMTGNRLAEELAHGRLLASAVMTANDLLLLDADLAICGNSSWKLDDLTPPAAVTDLAASETTQSSVTLTWTAPGDDGSFGTAAEYDVRYSTSPIALENWAEATQASGEPEPSSAGSYETLTISDLQPSTEYHVGLRTKDEVGNYSQLSNVVIVETPDPQPAATFVGNVDLSATEITLGEGVTITSSVQNDGAPSVLGGILYYFPAFTDPSDQGRISSASSGDLPGHALIHLGATIHSCPTCSPVVSQYLGAEYYDDDWLTGETNTYAVTVTPRVPGSFEILVRAGLTIGPAGSCVYAHAVPLNGVGATDQQECNVKRFVVTVKGSANDLVAYYPFTGDATDHSGQENHGTVHGATLTQDRHGSASSAYFFDGEDDYVEVPDSPSLDLSLEFAMSVWIMQTNAEPQGYRLIDKTTAGIGDGPLFDTYGCGEMTGRIMRLTYGPDWFCANTAYSLNEWHHLVATYSDGRVTFYLDANPDGSGESGSLMHVNGLTLRIGAAHGTPEVPAQGEYFEGAMDDIRIYNRALSEPEILALYTEGGWEPEDDPTLLQMVPVPAGTFTMGSDADEGSAGERPEHTPHVSDFEIDVYEVTNDHYCEALNWAMVNGHAYWNGSSVVESSEAVTLYLDVSSADCRVDFSGPSFAVEAGYGDHPVTDVSWYGAAAYCNWRSLREALTPCYDTSTWACDFGADGYRLPTEAEWEKAARGAADERTYPWGETVDCGRANYLDCHGASLAVGSHPSGVSPYGVHDMAGNVWEWCNDWYSSSYYASSAVTDPAGAVTGSERVVRGGSWFNDAAYVRCAFRHDNSPSTAHRTYGFRCARSQ